MGETLLRKALIADDDALVRAMLGSALRGLGFTVVEAQNGEEAVVLHEQERPDLLFLDLLMPKLNGLDALRRIRKEGAPHVPAVLVTALTRETVKQFEQDDVRPDAYLEKPFKLKAIARIVRQLVGLAGEAEGAA